MLSELLIFFGIKSIVKDIANCIDETIEALDEEFEDEEFEE